MDDRDREVEIALVLARRAYMYSLFHTAFGGSPSAKSVEDMFSSESLEAFRASGETIGAREASVQVGPEVWTLETGMKEAIACIERNQECACDAGFVEMLQSDFARLFEVPGDAYVHPWESPYVGKESMLFQESTLDVRRFYHEAGLKLRGEKSFPDDHIAAMMDYLGRLSQGAYEAFADGFDTEVVRLLNVQREFLDAHVLTWVGKFAASVMAKDVHAVYAAFALGLVAFVQGDRANTEALAVELLD